MVELDFSTMAPEVATLLNMRGNLVPPLRWGDEAYAPAKGRLDALKDAQLIEPHKPREREMLAALRALLHLWNGHLEAAAKSAEGAPKTTGLYIQGVVLRHQNRADDAKVCLRQVGGYATDMKLYSAASQLLPRAQHSLLKRFEDLLLLKKTWDPFAFVDLHKVAVDGRLDRPSELVIRNLQAEEFRLLLVHAYRKATGEDPTVRLEPADSPAKRRRDRDAADRKAAGTKAGAAAASKSEAAKPKDQKVRIGCPKCRHINALDASKRGGTVRCAKCTTPFTVPGGSGKAAGTAGVKVACPKCRAPGSYAAAMRGKTVRCKRCNATLIVPKAKSAA